MFRENAQGGREKCNQAAGGGLGNTTTLNFFFFPFLILPFGVHMWLQLRVEKKNKIKSLFIILQQRGADRNRNRFLQQTLACASAICLRAGADFSSFSRDVWVLQAPPSLSPPFSASPSSADKKQAVETRVERDKRRGHGKHPLFFFFFGCIPAASG